MPKRKSILKRVEIEVAQRRRTCKFSGEKIPRGEKCIVVYDGPRNSSGYSRQVALLMIEDARQLLTALEAEIQ